jgi:hypothetical protein
MMSADGRIHAANDHNNVTSVLRNAKKELHRVGYSEQKAWNGDIGVGLLHDNAHPHTAAHT